MGNNSAAIEDVREKALAEMLSSMSGVFTSNSAPARVPAISTGALSLDYALGVGGLPRGRIIEMYGPEGSGKTSLALSAAGHAISTGGLCGYVDVENAIDLDHARWMGVDTSYMMVTQPDSGEEALQKAEEFANRIGEAGLGGIVIVDSVAALVPKAELEGNIGDTHVGLTARLMSQALRKLSGVGNRTGVSFVFINQLREKIGQMYGNPETTPGGRALKFYASVRLDVRSSPSKQIKEGSGVNERVIGQLTTVTVKKNKVAPPFKKAEYRLIYGEGIDTIATIVDVAVNTGVWIKRAGGIYIDASTNEAIGRGEANVQQLMRSDPALAAATKGRVIEQMQAALGNEPTPEPAVAETGGFDSTGLDAYEPEFANA